MIYPIVAECHTFLALWTFLSSNILFSIFTIFHNWIPLFSLLCKLLVIKVFLLMFCDMLKTWLPCFFPCCLRNASSIPLLSHSYSYSSFPLQYNVKLLTSSQSGSLLLGRTTETLLALPKVSPELPCTSAHVIILSVLHKDQQCSWARHRQVSSSIIHKKKLGAAQCYVAQMWS